MKSIFRRKNIEKIYDIEGEIISRRRDEWNNTDITYTTVRIELATNKSRVLSEEIIGAYDLNSPLSVGEEFFLADIQETIKIKKAIRSSDGAVVYYVEDNYIETENTEKSYVAAIEKRDKANKLSDDLKRLRMEFDGYKREYKYKHRFFNFRKETDK